MADRPMLLEDPELKRCRLDWLRALWYKVIINGERLVVPGEVHPTFVWTLADIAGSKPGGAQVQFLADMEVAGWTQVHHRIVQSLARLPTLHLTLEHLQTIKKLTRRQNEQLGNGQLLLQTFADVTTRLPVPAMVDGIPCATAMKAVHAMVQLLTLDRSFLEAYLTPPVPPSRDTEAGRDYIYKTFDVNGRLGEDYKHIVGYFNALLCN